MTAAHEATVVGVRPRMTRKSLIVMVVAGLAYLAWAVLRRHYTVLVIVVVLWVYQLGIARRPATVVSAQGIRRPWRRRRAIAWAEVSSIAKPQLGQLSVRLNLADGKQVSLSDIAADRSATVAAIGGKEVAAAAAPPKAAPPPARPPTDEMRHADVTRQAADLSAGWRRLAEESDRIHPFRQQQSAE